METVPVIVDADQYAAALEPPRVRIEGRVYSGRVLSIEEWQPYGRRAKELNDAQQAKAEDPSVPAGLDAMAEEYFRAIFPKPPRWMPWRRDPVPALLRHPARLAILKGFFAHQVRQLKKLVAHLTDGTDSPS